jgi:hypothetical protein
MGELRTAIPYGCNDKIDYIGVVSSPTCRSENMIRKPWSSSLYITYAMSKGKKDKRTNNDL